MSMCKRIIVTLGLLWCLATCQGVRDRFLTKPPESAALWDISFVQIMDKLKTSAKFSSTSKIVFSRDGGSYSQGNRDVIVQDDVGNLNAILETPTHQLEIGIYGTLGLVRSDKGVLRKSGQPVQFLQPLAMQAFSGLPQVLKLLGTSLQMQKPHSELLGKRPSRKYPLTLSAQPLLESPPLGWLKDAKVSALSGNLWIDDATDVPLQLEVTAQIASKGEQLVLEYSGGFSEIGAIKTFSLPSYVDDSTTSKIEGGDPLSFFHKP
jgi:hypothetical protein